MIALKDISLSFPGVTVFQDFSLEIEHGQNVCLSGPSGKGKSSVLKMLQGYLLPDSGSIHINGLELNSTNVSKTRSRMAYVPQNINLPVDNGEELLKLLNAREHFEAADNFASLLDLPSEMLLKRFDEMSGGQKQRVVIAICLALDRSILLLDEPTSSLDDEAVETLANVLKQLRDKTIVSASHNPVWMNAVDKTVAL
jgi:polar amino acid transport system ATP-binding protein/putative ABC transport system ATP-binding protein